ncbi:MAG: hypothetical protein EYR95_04990, partial [Phormidium sp. SL48-SHIP]
MDVQLDFSDVTDLAAIGTQYASQGLTFSDNAIALWSRESGGRGNFAAAGGRTLMTYSGDEAIQVGIAETLPAIVAGQLTLRYTSPHLDHTIQVLDGTGAVIDSFVLPKTSPNLGVGGEFDRFQTVTVEFNGDGRSLAIGSFANQLGIDSFDLNLTFAEPEPEPEPEP